jgi:DNA-directed RNA polymerase subunit M
MKFCPKCGAVLVQKGKKDACPRCKYVSKDKTKISSSEKIGEKKEIMVISNKDAQVLPIVTEKCKKCGNDKAYFWTVQTRSGDEAETKFFKCTKCENTWREYR